MAFRRSVAVAADQPAGVAKELGTLFRGGITIDVAEVANVGLIHGLALEQWIRVQNVPWLAAKKLRCSLQHLLAVGSGAPLQAGQVGAVHDRHLRGRVFLGQTPELPPFLEEMAAVRLRDFPCWFYHYQYDGCFRRTGPRRQSHKCA